MFSPLLALAMARSVVGPYPFSWTEDGTAVDLTRPYWHRVSSTIPSPGGATTITNFTRNFSTVPAAAAAPGKMVVSVEQRAFGVEPGAVDTLVRFSRPVEDSSRPSGSREGAATSVCPPTPTLAAVNSLDVTLAVPPGGHAALHGFVGSVGASVDFSEYAEVLTPGGAPITKSPSGGRSSNGVLPFFAVHINTSGTGAGGTTAGLVLSIGWSGSWVMRAGLSADGKRVRVQAGLLSFNASLTPGQGFRAARVLAVSYAGLDVIDAWNRHRRVLSRHYVPKDAATGLLRGGLVSGWTAQTYNADLTEANMLAMVAGIKASGVEAAWIDFGWYIGGSLNAVGNWEMPPDHSVDKTKFPRSLAPIAEAAHNGGGGGPGTTKFIVWFEPERAGRSTYLGPAGPNKVPCARALARARPTRPRPSVPPSPSRRCTLSPCGRSLAPHSLTCTSTISRFLALSLSRSLAPASAHLGHLPPAPPASHA